MRVIPPCRQPEEPQAGQVKPPEACSSPTHHRSRDRHVPREKHFLLPGRREQTASPAVAKKSVYAQIYDLMRKRKLKMLTKLRELGLYMISSFFSPFTFRLLVFLLLVKFVKICLIWGFMHPRLILNSCNREQPSTFWSSSSVSQRLEFQFCTTVPGAVSETGVLLQYPTWPPDPGLKSSSWISLQRSWRFRHVPPRPALVLS